MMASKIEINRKFGSLKGKLTNIGNFIKNFDEKNTDVNEVKTRLEDLSNAYNKLDSIIEAYGKVLTDDEYDEVYPSFHEFTDSYHFLSAKLNALLPKTIDTSLSNVNNPNSVHNVNKRAVRLPDIPIPVFSGIGTEWLTFKQTFSTLIHENPDLNDIVKFTFLVDKLSGEAKQTLGHITLTAEGYEKAWETLLKRYDNSRIIISSHIEGLCSLSPVSKDVGKELRSLLNKCNSHVSSIEACGEDLDSLSNLFIVHLIAKKLDTNTRKEWEEKIALEDNVTWELLLDFLQNKCRIFEAMESLKCSSITAQSNSKTNSNNKQGVSKSFHSSASNASQNKTGSRCGVCKQQKHFLFACEEFKKMSPENRFKKIKDLRLCINCFSNSHTVSDCTSRNCKMCDKKHHTMLHRTILHPNLPDETLASDPTPEIVSVPTVNENTIVSLPCNNSINKQIILATSIVRIKDNKGRFHNCRALLDSGSQSNFISQNLVTQLNLKSLPIENLTISGINEKSTSISSQVLTAVHSKSSNYKKTLQFLVLPVITKKLPQTNLDISLWDIPSNIKLSDSCFNLSRPIDLLLGAEIYFEILIPKQLTIAPHLPILQESQFGWLVSGKFEHHCIETNCFMLQNAPQENLDNLVKRFWEMETLPPRVFLSKEEELCETHFEQNVKRDKTGRYIVALPHNDNILKLGESKDQALRRFYYLENKLYKNPELKCQYSDFIKEYIDLHHMEQVSSNQNEKDTVYYLPHHAVLRPDKSSTKLRVVFDASAQSSSNVSLNDTLLIGPNVQQSLFEIILRFRKHKFVFCSDISKMYRQILVQPKQTNLQRIFWRFDQNEPVNEYNLLTVTYGTSCAPYLATRCLKQLAIDESLNHPKSSFVLQSDFYVDDVLTGADSIEDALIIRDDLIQILMKGGFELHKWCANNELLLENIPKSKLEILQPNGFSNIETIKTLGLSWQPIQDKFVFDIKPFPIRITHTKRTILSDIASLFDPLGLIAPVIVHAKIFLQTLSRTYDWDDTINDIDNFKWKEFVNGIDFVKSVSLSRCVLPAEYDTVELHGFSDASEKAYCACLYLRALFKGEPVSVVLLCSKTRVAPLRNVSLPRLELSAALLLVQLTKSVYQSMNIKFSHIYLWTDSTITLFWIKTPPFKLKTFVANRVSEIQELSEDVTWNHVKSQQNPADVGSRGVILSNMNQLHEWWYGPEFLYSTIVFANLPSNIVLNETQSNESIVELKRETVSLIVQQSPPEFDLWFKYSRLKTLQRVFAFVLRFVSNCRNKNKLTRVKEADLSVLEVDKSLQILILFAQKEEFESEISDLLKGNPVSNKSKLKQLNPFLDNANLIRVGGRLNKTNFAQDVKNQVVLPAKHILTKLIFEQYHYEQLHPGQNLLLSFVRQRFWPINGKATSRKICRNCVICVKSKPILSQQIMGDLPADRITPSRPFSVTGVDLCGPFLIRQKFQRRDNPTKIYVASFVCFVSKAVHLEVVSDLSSEGFISCLKRFIYRRGKPNKIWSDNATNFTGTANILKKQFQLYLSQSDFDEVNKFCVDQQISWNFIPPRSPHFGGLWESSIKSFKSHFKKVAGTKQFTYEEFNTLIIHIEGILNSRPLTIISNDPSDPMPLTPGHFTTGGPIVALTEPSTVDLPSNTLSNWENIYCIAQRFWKRFSLEYIHKMQERTKWKTISPNLKCGDIVLVIDKNSHSTNWLYGKIEGVKRANDGNVRVVSVRTKNGIIDRAITNVCKLPVDV